MLTSNLENGSRIPKAASCYAGETPYPAFLSKHWFHHQNASALRKHIRNLILQLFREQKRLPDDHQTVVNAVADMADYQENKNEPKYGLLLQQLQVALQLYFDINCRHRMLLMLPALQLGKHQVQARAVTCL